MPMFLRENFTEIRNSILGHGLLFIVMSLNLVLIPAQSPQPLQLAIEATVIDVAEIRRRENEVMERQRAIDRQKQAQADARKKEQAAKRRKAEVARIAEQKQKAETERERLKEQQRKESAARAAEQKRKEDAEQKRAVDERRRIEAEEKRRQAEMQANLHRELEAEEHRLAAISSGKLAEYLAMIGDRVERNWVQPLSANPDVECVVHVTQIPGGEVVNVRVGRCNGDTAVVRSIEAAVFNASPLPLPPDPSLFDRILIFTFKPEDIAARAIQE
jgi:colicin import membrane protein